MSKASEWVKEMIRRKTQGAPQFKFSKDRGIAMVTECGDLHISHNPILSSDVLSFRDWLTATFDEPPESKG